jgi:hypothetical protein
MNKNPNPLYYCNKASVLYNMNLKEEALLNFKKAQELIQNTKSFKGLSKKNIDSINNTLEIFTIIDDLNRICLKKIDEFFIKRETKFINSFIKDLENANFTENKNQEGQALKTLKEEIVFIQENMPKLYEYYDGFLYTMMQTYQISVVINKETFVLDSTTISFKIGIQLLSYIPLIGNTLKKILQNAYEFKNETKIMNKAINVTKFATTYLDFQDLAQDSIMHFIKINFNEINNLKPELEILPRWAKQYKDVLKKYKLSEYDLYGSRNETNMQKFGAQQASLLIERYIANGIIYGDNPAISLKPKEKKDKIFTYLSKIFSEELTNNKNLINDSNKNNDKIDKNCYVFYNNIKYDNEILNHPKLLNQSIKIFGLKYIMNSYEKLDKELIQEAIFNSNHDLLIAGLMSVYEPTEEVF